MHKTSWIRVPGWLWANLGNRRLDGVTMQKTHAWFVLEPKRSSNVISTNSIWEVSERTSDKWQDGNVYPLQASDCKESAPAHHRGSYVLRDVGSHEAMKPWAQGVASKELNRVGICWFAQEALNSSKTAIRNDPNKNEFMSRSVISVIRRFEPLKEAQKEQQKLQGNANSKAAEATGFQVPISQALPACTTNTYNLLTVEYEGPHCKTVSNFHWAFGACKHCKNFEVSASAKKSCKKCSPHLSEISHAFTMRSPSNPPVPLLWVTEGPAQEIHLSPETHPDESRDLAKGTNSQGRESVSSVQSQWKPSCNNKSNLTRAD